MATLILFLVALAIVGTVAYDLGKHVEREEWKGLVREAEMRMQIERIRQPWHESPDYVPEEWDR